MVIPHRKLSIDINRPNHYTVDFIAHVCDKNTRYIDITLNADGEPIELEQGCTATVTYVSDGVLIEQEAECDVDGSTVIVGIDTEKVKSLRSGILEIQPKIVDSSGNIIVSQIPVLVRISPDIAEHGRVDDDSLGTYAEVVREIAAARGSYTDLKERLDHTGAPTDEQVAEAVSDYLDEHPIEDGFEKISNKKTSISNQSQTGDSDTYYPTVGAVRDFVNLVKSDLEDYVDDEIGSIPEVTVDSAFSQASTNPVQNKIVTAKLNEIISGKADKSTTLSGYGITNAYTKTEVDYAIRTAIGGVENGSY